MRNGNDYAPNYYILASPAPEIVLLLDEMLFFFDWLLVVFLLEKFLFLRFKAQRDLVNVLVETTVTVAAYHELLTGLRVGVDVG